MKHRVIYVPGILDNIYHIQSTLVATWRFRGLHGHCHPIPWAGPEAWQSKFGRLLAEIDRYSSQGDRVSLVGASAGASAVLNAYIERADRIMGLVYICAKINRPNTVSRKTYEANPAFEDSLRQLQANLPRLNSADKAKMLSLYSPTDTTVPRRDTTISGVTENQLPRLDHGKAILYSLGPGAERITGFLKDLTPKD